MTSPTVQPTRDTKSGSETTSVKTKLKRKEGKIKEVEASVTHDGKFVYHDDEGEKEFVVDDYHSYNVAIGMCQTENVEAMEVSEKFFTMLAKGKETPFIVAGVPAVKVFPLGKMDKGLKILSLTRDKYLDLVAKKAREEAAAKKAEEDMVTSLD